MRADPMSQPFWRLGKLKFLLSFTAQGPCFLCGNPQKGVQSFKILHKVKKKAKPYNNSISVEQMQVSI